LGLGSKLTSLAPSPGSVGDGSSGDSIRASGHTNAGDGTSADACGPPADDQTTDELLIAQIAAWVRFWTPTFRRIALTWTFTVASAMLILRAMPLLELPSTMQRRMHFSRADRRVVPLNSADGDVDTGSSGSRTINR